MQVVPDLDLFVHFPLDTVNPWGGMVLMSLVIALVSSSVLLYCKWYRAF